MSTFGLQNIKGDIILGVNGDQFYYCAETEVWYLYHTSKLGEAQTFVVDESTLHECPPPPMDDYGITEFQLVHDDHPVFKYWEEMLVLRF